LAAIEILTKKTMSARSMLTCHSSSQNVGRRSKSHLKAHSP